MFGLNLEELVSIVIYLLIQEHTSLNISFCFTPFITILELYHVCPVAFLLHLFSSVSSLSLNCEWNDYYPIVFQVLSTK